MVLEWDGKGMGRCWEGDGKGMGRGWEGVGKGLGWRWVLRCPKSSPAAMSKSKPRATIVITRADAYTIEGLGIGYLEPGTRISLGASMASGMGMGSHCSPKDALHFNEDIRREQRAELR